MEWTSLLIHWCSVMRIVCNWGHIRPLQIGCNMIISLGVFAIGFKFVHRICCLQLILVGLHTGLVEVCRIENNASGIGRLLT